MAEQKIEGTPCVLSVAMQHGGLFQAGRLHLLLRWVSALRYNPPLPPSGPLSPIIDCQPDEGCKASGLFPHPQQREGSANVTHKDATLCQRSLTMQGVRHEAEFKLPCDSPVYHCSHLQVHSRLMSEMIANYMQKHA